MKVCAISNKTYIFPLLHHFFEFLKSWQIGPQYFYEFTREFKNILSLDISDTCSDSCKSCNIYRKLISEMYTYFESCVTFPFLGISFYEMCKILEFLNDKIFSKFIVDEVTGNVLNCIEIFAYSFRSKYFFFSLLECIKLASFISKRVKIFEREMYQEKIFFCQEERILKVHFEKKSFCQSCLFSSMKLTKISRNCRIKLCREVMMIIFSFSYNSLT